MINRSAFEKRLRRHIVGRVREYFAATAPGLESLCRQELQSLPLTVQESRTCPGGVTFQGRLVDCFMANLYLRTANRILMRIDSFKATRFQELEKKLSEWPWELFLQPQQAIDFHVSTKKSKLYHTDAIADRFRSSIANRISVPQQAGYGRYQRRDPQRIFVRGINDRFTVSLDSSGVNLHKRGIKTISAKAPLRETTAAAIMMLADYSPPEPLLDPMCGSGTFSVEAALMAGNIPAGWYRTFAFTDWPAFRQASKRWKHLKREANEHISIAKQPLVLASDIDPQACQALEKTVRRHRFGSFIDVSPGDFFDLHPPQYPPGCGLVVINPPYGRRLKTPKEARSLLARIGRKLMNDFQGWKYALIVPAQSMLQQFPLPAKVVPIFHGGLQVSAAIGVVPAAAQHRSPQMP